MIMKPVFEQIACALDLLSTELTEAEVNELVMLANTEQERCWQHGSSGWKVLEAFKEFVQDK